jgi:2-dehydro-3-deoxyphosphooctonate aldolase (KDO 8-P synthase)
MSISFQVGDIHIGSGDLFLIAGPCVIESEEHTIRMAEIIKGVARSLNFPFIFKASYDKANRTSIRSYRGPGLKEGLRILKKVKDEIHIPILTDVHEATDDRGCFADSRIFKPADGSRRGCCFERARGEP